MLDSGSAFFISDFLLYSRGILGEFLIIFHFFLVPIFLNVFVKFYFESKFFSFFSFVKCFY